MIIITKLAAMNIIFQLALAKQYDKSQTALARKRLMEISEEINKFNYLEKNFEPKIFIDFTNKYLANDLIKTSSEYEILCNLKKIFQHYILSDIPVDTRAPKLHTYNLKITTQNKTKFILVPQTSNNARDANQTMSRACINMTFENNDWKISGFEITDVFKN